MIDQYVLKRKEFSSMHEKESSVFLNKLPVQYLNFLMENGCVEFIDTMEISKEGTKYLVGDFYTLKEINSLLETPQLLPQGFIPFCDGQTNDYIGFKENDEHIYYLYGDRHSNEDSILIADNFVDFIENIIPIKEKEPDNRKITDVNLSPEFLNLLKNREK